MSVSPSPNSNDHRITILLLGSDQRNLLDQNSIQDDLCTDAIIVLSINPDLKTAFLLSLPRDIYCQISREHGMGRINTAYQLGEASGDPHGGGMLAAAAVQNLLQIHI